MPISAAMFRSERKNPVPQCPPRLDVQMLTPVIWSRMPNHFLNPEVGRVSERLGWMVECIEPLIMMALHIPEENRSEVNLGQLGGGSVGWGDKEPMRNRLTVPDRKSTRLNSSHL